MVCIPGHYCPLNTEFATQFPCAAGKFNTLPNSEDVSSCEDCTPGSYCPIPGMTNPAGLCSPGWFCTLSATQNMPTDSTGGQCVAGEYCPEGASAPITCDPG